MFYGYGVEDAVKGLFFPLAGGCAEIGILSFRPQEEIFKLSYFSLSRFLAFARNDHFCNDDTVSGGDGREWENNAGDAGIEHFHPGPPPSRGTGIFDFLRLHYVIRKCRKKEE
ncbi:MAG TPA: hypothetical protein PK425_11845 [Syntrophales bacterium]|nr:hypothetical protein [Syntrophales bacterium]